MATIAHNDKDFKKIMETLIFQACYYMPTLFDDHGGKLAYKQKAFKIILVNGPYYNTAI